MQHHEFSFSPRFNSHGEFVRLPPLPRYFKDSLRQLVPTPVLARKYAVLGNISKAHNGKDSFVYRPWALLTRYGFTPRAPWKAIHEFSPPLKSPHFRRSQVHGKTKPSILSPFMNTWCGARTPGLQLPAISSAPHKKARGSKLIFKFQVFS